MKKTHLMALTLVSFLGLNMGAAQAQNAGMPENVLKIIKTNKDTSKFADLVSSAGLESELTQKDTMTTVFAPSNAAMDKIPSDVMKKAKAEKDGLKSLVRYHMINGSAVFGGNIKGRRASPSTANGEMVGFDGMGKELKVNDAVITTPDQTAINGVVHVINAPLIPLSLNEVAKDKIKEAQEAERKKMDEQMKEREAAMEAERAKNAPKAAAADKKAKEAAKAPSVENATEPKAEEAAAPVVASPDKPVSVPAAKKPAEEKSLWKSLFGK